MLTALERLDRKSFQLLNLVRVNTDTGLSPLAHVAKHDQPLSVVARLSLFSQANFFARQSLLGMISPFEITAADSRTSPVDLSGLLMT